jgi:glycosyltransferase involved in cell wall biosynthesis
MKLIFCYRHIAPYHIAQLKALGQSGISVTAIHYGNFKEAAFKKEDIPFKSFEEIILLEPEGMWSELYHVLDRMESDAVLVPGWGHAYGLAALHWAVRNQVPCIVISDSQEHEYPRRRVAEIIKRKILRLYSAAFVAGQRSREYLIKLGMPPEKITVGCDVVDNDHFLQGADAARENEDAVRRIQGLPQRYFLSVNRLTPEKNVASIIRAYASYCDRGAPGNWYLVIVGDGPLRHDLKKLAADLQIENLVLFRGVQTYNDMPSFYGLASTLILASFQEQWGLVVNEAMCAKIPVLVSELCGCSNDLVVDRKNGFRFNPHDTENLARLMTDFAAGQWDISSMGQESCTIIGSWSLDKYVTNLLAAVDIACHVPLSSRSIRNKVLLQSVMNWLPNG